VIDVSYLKGKKVAVLGLGRAGLANCIALEAANVEYSAWDDKAQAREEALSKRLKLADSIEDFLSGTDMMIISPGIPHTLPEPHATVKLAKEQGISLYSDIHIFREAAPDIDVIGVTGTNGKSTTTTLLGHVLGKNMTSQIGGNIGIPSLSLSPETDATVLELSSYQIELTDNLNATGAIWLNISPDHIDRHGSIEGYVAAKLRIFERNKSQGIAVIGVDDTHSKDVADQISKRDDWTVIPVSMTDKLDHGISVIDGQLYKDGEFQIDISTLPTLKGVHNHQNAACVYGIASYVYSMDNAVILAQLQSFDGLAHRQFVVEKKGSVTFINDSKATNAEATAKALSSFQNIFWIAGGQAKEGGLSGLEVYKDRIEKTYLIGEAQDNFAAFLDGQGMVYEKCFTLDKAVSAAYRDASNASNSSTVLLSPACASWDQYRSFEHRGDDFETFVKNLK